MTRIELPDYDIVGIRADNPGPFTLSGTNSWIVGRGPTWLIDPGPALEPHLRALTTEIDKRGGLGGIALTHDHLDHAAAVPAIRERFADAPVAAGRGEVDVALQDGTQFGPLIAMYTPGHASDHFVLRTGADRDPSQRHRTEAAFTGDAVLGEGSVFVSPEPGSLAGYLNALERLKARRPAILCPGHGPPVKEAVAKLDEYISHRLDRERRLLEALAAGRRTADELLDEVWDDAPAPLRGAAAVTLAAHLDKLEEEGRLPPDVERPALSL